MSSTKSATTLTFPHITYVNPAAQVTKLRSYNPVTTTVPNAFLGKLKEYLGVGTLVYLKLVSLPNTKFPRELTRLNCQEL